MRRLLLITLFATSLLGCIGLAALWLRSYQYADRVEYCEKSGITDRVDSILGVLAYDRGWYPPRGDIFFTLATPGKFAATSMRLDSFGKRVTRLKWSQSIKWEMHSAAFVGGSRYTRVYLRVPHCFGLILFAPGLLWPALRWWRWHRRKMRALHGYCIRCGYDLRASPVRCPECGMPRSDVGNDCRDALWRTRA
jgi:hypothetical protein